MRTSFPWILILLFWIMVGNPINGQPEPTPGAPPPRLGIVFVVNGSGDDTTVTDNLYEIIEARCLPLALHTIRWCRWAQVGRDHRDFTAQIVGADKLASQVATHRQRYPQEKIMLISHSAGSNVILQATRMLPPHTVDRIFLLAPSVSQYHDLRPALSCSRGGIDSFWSTADGLVALGSDLFGNADKLPGKPAGAVGFTLLPPTVPDAHLYNNLRQYAWNPCWAITGHSGTHAGYTRLGFLDTCIVPLMLENDR